MVSLNEAIEAIEAWVEENSGYRETLPCGDAAGLRKLALRILRVESGVEVFADFEIDPSYVVTLNAASLKALAERVVGLPNEPDLSSAERRGWIIEFSPAEWREYEEQEKALKAWRSRHEHAGRRVINARSNVEYEKRKVSSLRQDLEDNRQRWGFDTVSATISAIAAHEKEQKLCEEILVKIEKEFVAVESEKP